MKTHDYAILDSNVPAVMVAIVRAPSAKRALMAFCDTRYAAMAATTEQIMEAAKKEMKIEGA